MEPQNWYSCDSAVKAFIHMFIRLVTDTLGAENVEGIYLHGSLATGSYYMPKSDMDMLAVVKDKLEPDTAKKLNKQIALLDDTRPTAGSIEFSIITADTAKRIPIPMPYELHYSAAWHDRILGDAVIYGAEQYDTDLQAHLFCLTGRGICVFGKPINRIFGQVKWEDFLYAVLDDLDWILADEHIVESPYYGILNICRVFQLLVEKEPYPYSKDEGGLWGLQYFPVPYTPLITAALEVYHDNKPLTGKDRKTGGVAWDKDLLLRFRDYIREQRLILSL